MLTRSDRDIFSLGGTTKRRFAYCHHARTIFIGIAFPLS